MPLRFIMGTKFEDPGSGFFTSGPGKVLISTSSMTTPFLPPMMATEASIPHRLVVAVLGRSGFGIAAIPAMAHVSRPESLMEESRGEQAPSN